jgi:hypothetical protein
VKNKIKSKIYFGKIIICGFDVDDDDDMIADERRKKINRRNRNFFILKMNEKN